MLKIDYDKLAMNWLIFQLVCSKTYWSIFKTYCCYKKIPFIPPIYIRNKLESNFKLCISTSILFLRFSRISTLNVIEDDIMKIVRDLGINEVHGHGVKPFSWIYKEVIDTGFSQIYGEKPNIVPVHEKGSKQIIDN